MALAKDLSKTKRTRYERQLDSLATIFSANSTCTAVLLIPNEIIVGFNDDALQNSAQMINEFFRILLSESTEKEEALLELYMQYHTEFFIKSKRDIVVPFLAKMLKDMIQNLSEYECEKMFFLEYEINRLNDNLIKCAKRMEEKIKARISFVTNLQSEEELLNYLTTIVSEKYENSLKSENKLVARVKRDIKKIVREIQKEYSPIMVAIRNSRLNILHNCIIVEY